MKLICPDCGDEFDTATCLDPFMEKCDNCFYPEEKSSEDVK